MNIPSLLLVLYSMDLVVESAAIHCTLANDSEAFVVILNLDTKGTLESKKASILSILIDSGLEGVVKKTTLLGPLLSLVIIGSTTHCSELVLAVQVYSTSNILGHTNGLSQVEVREIDDCEQAANNNNKID